jgi:D-glycero-D-manno-heptose 1,7-bisphosphate phosphatase
VLTLFIRSIDDRLSIIVPMNQALFLDRDGVIIANRADYVRTWSDVSIYPQALSSLQKINSSDYKIFIVTNQSPIGRGIISYNEAEQINWQLIKEIESAGGRIDAVYMCPHTAEDNCLCRKPQPGMILQAAAEFSIDLAHSILIGDAISDIIAGQTAGIGVNVLVKTGRGAAQIELPLTNQVPPFLVNDSLAEALSDLIP